MNRLRKNFPADHSLISPTAKLVAWWRSFSDIPYATEVAGLAGARDTVEAMLAKAGVTPDQTHWGAPVLELRYKSLMREIKESGCKQVLEIASGIALRALVMTADPAIQYIETDLPGITREKVEIVHKIIGSDPMTFRSNLRFAEANALDMPGLERAVEGFDQEASLAIVHEGLLQYFSRAEIEAMTRNMAGLLRRFGGVWISPDFELRSGLAAWRQAGPEVAKVLDAIKEATGREMLEGAFESGEELRAFMDSEGLVVERVPQMSPGIEISSAASSGIPPEFLEKILASMTLCRIRLKG
ncbi:MAG: hypothetical protein RIQ81_2040 [Pseudomonadota bacterium]